VSHCSITTQKSKKTQLDAIIKKERKAHSLVYTKEFFMLTTSLSSKLKLPSISSLSLVKGTCEQKFDYSQLLSIDAGGNSGEMTSPVGK